MFSKNTQLKHKTVYVRQSMDKNADSIEILICVKANHDIERVAQQIESDIKSAIRAPNGYVEKKKGGDM